MVWCCVVIVVVVVSEVNSVTQANSAFYPLWDWSSIGLHLITVVQS